jgi:hypothetical protein
VQGNYAYLASDAGLDIIDIHDPSQPTFISRYGTKVREVATGGGYVFVLDWDDGLAALDVSDPRRPQRIAWDSTIGLISSSMAVYNGYCYIANGNSGLEIVDVRDPVGHGLQLVKTLGYVGLPRVERATSFESKLFVSSSDGIVGFNLQDPANLTWFAGNQIWGHDFVVSGRYLFEAAREGFSIYEAANFSRPILVSNVPFTLWAANAIGVIAKVAYVADLSEGIKIFDVADVYAPRLIAAMPDVFAQQIVTTPDYVYVVDQSGLAIFHLFKPSSDVRFEPVGFPDPTHPSIRIYGPKGVPGRIEQTTDLGGWQTIESVGLPGDSPVIFTPTLDSSPRHFFRFVSP